MVSGKSLQPGECAEAIRVLAQLWQLDEAATLEKVVASFRELVSL
jgi:hypothetical protein